MTTFKALGMHRVRAMMIVCIDRKLLTTCRTILNFNHHASMVEVLTFILFYHSIQYNRLALVRLIYKNEILKIIGDRLEHVFLLFT